MGATDLQSVGVPMCCLDDSYTPKWCEIKKHVDPQDTSAKMCGRRRHRSRTRQELLVGQMMCDAKMIQIYDGTKGDPARLGGRVPC